MPRQPKSCSRAYVLLVSFPSNAPKSRKYPSFLNCRHSPTQASWPMCEWHFMGGNKTETGRVNNLQLAMPIEFAGSLMCQHETDSNESADPVVGRNLRI